MTSRSTARVIWTRRRSTRRVEGTDQIVEELEAKGYLVSARRLGGGLVASGEASSGAMLFGLDIERDRAVSRVSQEVEHGEWISADDPTGVVLGRRLARSLDVGLGDELIVLSQAADGGMANDLYFVRGILRSVSESIDRAGLYMPRATFEDFFAFDRDAHQIVVRKPEGMDTAVATEAVRQVVAAISQQSQAMSWRELLPTLATMVDSMRAAITMVILIIYLAIAILILNAMLMAVFERLKELGVLKAIGMQPGTVFRLMMTEALIQALCAVVIAVLLSVPLLYYMLNYGINVGALGGVGVAGMTFDPVWNSAVTPMTFAGPIGVLLFLVVLAVIYPGLKAARLSPVEAMRHQ